MKNPLLWLGVAASLALAQPAWAQSPEEIQIARQTAVEGLGAYKTGDYTKALGLFEQAKALYPSAQVLRMLGYSHLALEHWEKAVAELEASLEAKISPLDEEDRKDVESQLAKALAHFGTVTVTSKVAGAELIVDEGEPHPLPLEKPLRLLEGKHWFKVRAPEHVDASEEVEIAGGKAVEIALEPTEKEKPNPPPPKPAAPPPPPPRKAWFPHQKPIGFALAGTGVALGAATLVTALAGAHIRSNVAADVDIHKQFYGENCDRGDRRLCMFDRAVINSDADRADALRDASVWLGISAGVLAASGAVLVIMAPKEQPKTEPATAPAPTPSSPGAPAASSQPTRRDASVSMQCSLAGLGLGCAGTF